MEAGSGARAATWGRGGGRHSLNAPPREVPRRSCRRRCGALTTDPVPADIVRWVSSSCFRAAAMNGSPGESPLASSAQGPVGGDRVRGVLAPPRSVAGDRCSRATTCRRRRRSSLASRLAVLVVQHLARRGVLPTRGSLTPTRPTSPPSSMATSPTWRPACAATSGASSEVIEAARARRPWALARASRDGGTDRRRRWSSALLEVAELERFRAAASRA